MAFGKQTAPAPSQAPSPVDVLGAWLKSTVTKSIAVGTVPWVDGQLQTLQVPRNGLGRVIWLVLQANIAVSGTTGGTFAGWPNPAPFSIIKQITFGNNNQTNIHAASLWSLYKWASYRYGVDPLSTGSTTSFATSNAAALGVSAPTHAIVPNNTVSNQTYTFNICLPISLAYNETGEQGLLLLKQPSIFYTVGVQWGQIVNGVAGAGGSNDLFQNVTTSTSVVITPTINCYLELEYFEANTGWNRFATKYMSTTDNPGVFSPLVTGSPQFYTVPQQELLTMMIGELYNNGAKLSNSSINLAQLVYQGNNYRFVENYLVNNARAYWEHKIVPRDGEILIDLGATRGVDKRRDALLAQGNDVTSQVQFYFQVSNTVTPTGQSGLSFFSEQLNPMQSSAQVPT